MPIQRTVGRMVEQVTPNWKCAVPEPDITCRKVWERKQIHRKERCTRGMDTHSIPNLTYVNVTQQEEDDANQGCCTVTSNIHPVPFMTHMQLR